MKVFMVDSEISIQRCNPISNASIIVYSNVNSEGLTLACNSSVSKQLLTQGLVIPDTALSKPVYHACSRYS